MKNKKKCVIIPHKKYNNKEANGMKAKSVLKLVMTSAAILSLSVNVLAAGSITNAVDNNNVSAETTTKEVVGGKTEITVQEVGVTLEAVTSDTFPADIQKEVDALNQADADTTLLAAFESIFSKDEMPQVDLYDVDGLAQENMNLEDFKFLSPVMNLILDEEPTEENPVDVTFTVNNLTDKVEPFILHRCDKHGWELLKTEKVSENQIKAAFHSAGGPVAVVYRQLQEEATETDAETVAP